MKMVANKLFVLFLTSIGTSDGFVVTQVGNHNSVNRIALSAKGTKKKKKNSSTASGGGFGRVKQIKKANEVVDFSVFPALDGAVAETLVPSVSELFNESGELPDEIYDRLDQIYGFPDFNYIAPQEDTVSFADLISAPTTSTESKISDNHFASLLAAATGEIDYTPSDRLSVECSSIDAISTVEAFSKMRVLHIDPLLIAVDDFFTDDECDRYVAMSTTPSKNKKDSPFKTNSKTVGKDSLAKAQRTSTTWFHHYKSAYELVAKASRLLGLKGIDQWEEPQTVRYGLLKTLSILLASHISHNLHHPDIVVKKSSRGTWMLFLLQNAWKILEVNGQQRSWCTSPG